ncbi:hypothetical protein [Fusobacterium sp. HMSC073F01]|uniref:hypothetical protein n=1 Tax=Fusobacterium sp. HMSC073F01 TaxID=1739251 RepID=UPI0008A62EB2|nr:hypothetical protein [Fusobacterium sp. HMSC073F01]OFL94184.1 hypothetical protein HMPREF2747_16110 [Fusobacterium sp. HMSC073F01]
MKKIDQESERDKENSKIRVLINYLYKKLEEKNEAKIDYYSFSKEKIINLCDEKDWQQIIRPAYLNKEIDMSELLKVKKEDYKKLLEILLEIESTFTILINEEFIKLDKIIEEKLLKFSFEMDTLKKYECIRYCYKEFIKEKYFNYNSKRANKKLEKYFNEDEMEQIKENLKYDYIENKEFLEFYKEKYSEIEENEIERKSMDELTNDIIDFLEKKDIHIFIEPFIIEDSKETKVYKRFKIYKNNKIIYEMEENSFCETIGICQILALLTYHENIEKMEI